MEASAQVLLVRRIEGELGEHRDVDTRGAERIDDAAQQPRWGATLDPLNRKAARPWLDDQTRELVSSIRDQSNPQLVIVARTLQRLLEQCRSPKWRKGKGGAERLEMSRIPEVPEGSHPSAARRDRRHLAERRWRLVAIVQEWSRT
ncbi:MAG: hypothetical protein IPM79_15630 [Polyangiaceae bacterium]|nr:hypothetical protein [Polyangiaceae bacterium]MBK8939011.1 hypothetical protein [Polyangiaceae bacterium]